MERVGCRIFQYLDRRYIGDRPSGDRVNPDWLLNPNSDTADWTLRSDLPQTDWVDAILQTAFTHSHQVSVSSKGDRYATMLLPDT